MHSHLPAAVPLLSRGKHRNPRKGACFMEFASYLAGERWSDHPACTHPLLAAMARLVNDYTTDANRQRLTPLIPSVIGLTTTDPRADVRIALRAATTALPVVAAERQLALAVSVLASEHVLADLDGREPGLEPASKEALDLVPEAARWAYGFRSGVKVSRRGFRRYAAPNTVQLAVRGVSQACVDDPDAILRDLLTAAIGDVQAMVADVVATDDQVDGARPLAFKAGR